MIDFRKNFIPLGFVSGLGISYSSATAIAVASGKAMINGVLQSYAGATLTSGSTMKDLNNATVTLGASKAYHVYLWNNAGTIQIAVQDWSNGTYGGTPTYDATNDYFEAAYSTVGANARRIGKFWTDASNNILQFVTSGRGRRRRTEIGLLKVLSAGMATTSTSITITPYITPDDDQLIMAPQNNAGQSASFFTLSTGVITITSGTDGANFQLGGSALSIPYLITGTYELGNTGTLNYFVYGTNGTNLFLGGFVQTI